MQRTAYRCTASSSSRFVMISIQINEDLAHVYIYNLIFEVFQLKWIDLNINQSLCGAPPHRTNDPWTRPWTAHKVNELLNLLGASNLTSIRHDNNVLIYYADHATWWCKGIFYNSLQFQVQRIQSISRTSSSWVNNINFDYSWLFKFCSDADQRLIFLKYLAFDDR